MTLEDNSDLRAAMNFAHNAVRKVLHVYIITQDAPRQSDKTTQSTGMVREESFHEAVKELNKNN